MDMERETQIFDCLAELYMEAELDVVREDSSHMPLRVSDRFHRRIQWIIRKERAIAVARRVAAVILAMITVTGSLMLINEDVRAEIIRFFRKIYPTHTEYQFNEEAIEWEGDFRFYEPTWLPEGYEEVYRSMRAEGDGSIRYDNRQGEKVKEIFFECMDERVTGLSLNTENTNRREISYQGGRAEFYESYEEGFLNSFVWGNEYRCRFVLHGDLALEEFIRIADSLEERTPELKCKRIETPEGYQLVSLDLEWGREESEEYTYQSDDGLKVFSLKINGDFSLVDLIGEEEREEKILYFNGYWIRCLDSERDTDNIYVWKDEQGQICILQGSLERAEALRLINSVNK